MNPAVPRDAPENPYAVEDPPVWSSDGRRDRNPPQPPKGVYERGLAACRAILREHGAPEHGPHYTPRPKK
jgi:hypothetical protein